MAFPLSDISDCQSTIKLPPDAEVCLQNNTCYVARTRSVGYVPKYNLGVSFLSTLPTSAAWFRTVSQPLPDTEVLSSARLQYRYLTLSSVRYTHQKHRRCRYTVLNAPTYGTSFAGVNRIKRAPTCQNLYWSRCFHCEYGISTIQHTSSCCVLKSQDTFQCQDGVDTLPHSSDQLLASNVVLHQISGNIFQMHAYSGLNTATYQGN